MEGHTAGKTHIYRFTAAGGARVAGGSASSRVDLRVACVVMERGAGGCADWSRGAAARRNSVAREDTPSRATCYPSGRTFEPLKDFKSLVQSPHNALMSKQSPIRSDEHRASCQRHDQRL